MSNTRVCRSIDAVRKAIISKDYCIKKVTEFVSGTKRRYYVVFTKKGEEQPEFKVTRKTMQNALQYSLDMEE